MREKSKRSELEIGAAKWRKEHVPCKGNDLNELTEEGVSLLDDMELWWDKQNLLWACHTSRKKDRMNIDGTFHPHQGGGREPRQDGGVAKEKKQSDPKINGG